MLLTLTTTYQPATDLGFLLHKNPDRFQSFNLSFGQARVFYAEATDDSCAASLLLDVDPGGEGAESEFLVRTLSDGVSPSQPMITFWSQGTRDQQRDRAQSEPVDSRL